MNYHRYSTAKLLGCLLVLLAGSPSLHAEATTNAPEILTPKPSPAPPINGPVVYGCRPGNPFLYRIPCTGERPIQFFARPLPKTLAVDAATRIIIGTTPAKGEYEVMFIARNSHRNDPFIINL